MTIKRSKTKALTGVSPFIAEECPQPPIGYGFELPFPPSVNAIWRRVGRKTLLSAAARRYRGQVVQRLLQQFGKLPRVGNGPLAVTIRARRPDARRRDLDNLPKAILDALTHAGLWGDDSQIEHLAICWAPLARAGVFVNVAPVISAKEIPTYVMEPGELVLTSRRIDDIQAILRVMCNA